MIRKIINAPKKIVPIKKPEHKLVCIYREIENIQHRNLYFAECSCGKHMHGYTEREALWFWEVHAR